MTAVSSLNTIDSRGSCFIPGRWPSVLISAIRRRDDRDIVPERQLLFSHVVNHISTQLPFVTHHLATFSARLSRLQTTQSIDKHENDLELKIAARAGILCRNLDTRVSPPPSHTREARHSHALSIASIFERRTALATEYGCCSRPPAWTYPGEHRGCLDANVVMNVSKAGPEVRCMSSGRSYLHEVLRKQRRHLDHYFSLFYCLFSVLLILSALLLPSFLSLHYRKSPVNPTTSYHNAFRRRCCAGFHPPKWPDANAFGGRRRQWHRTPIRVSRADSRRPIQGPKSVSQQTAEASCCLRWRRRIRSVSIVQDGKDARAWELGAHII